MWGQEEDRDAPLFPAVLETHHSYTERKSQWAGGLEGMLADDVLMCTAHKNREE